MNFIIRKIEDTENEYFAYVKLNHIKATYFIYFQDNIMGAVQLHNFIDMLKNFYKPKHTNISVCERDITLKNEYVLEIIRHK